MNNSILVIGDCHVSDNQDLSRFTIASKFIVDEKPDYIIIIGDFLTLDALSAWDRNKRKKMEGRRYNKEIEAGNEALDLLFHDMKQYNVKRSKRHRKQYKPEIVYIEGNHEDRLTRYLDTDPTFDGMVGVKKDLKLDKRKIKFVPYKEYYYVNGIGFTHIPFNKMAPVSGIDITRKASMVNVNSVVFGHTHEQHLSHIHKQGQEHLQDIYCCGCFFEHKDDYVRGCVTQYWVGLTILDNWKTSRFDVRSYSLSNLKRRYEDQ